MKKRLLFKFAALNIAIVASLAGFFSYDKTQSFFSDTERSVNNTIRAGQLSFSVDAQNGNFTPAIAHGQDGGLTATVSLQNPAPLSLTVKAENPVGGLCGGLLLSAVNGANDSGKIDLVQFMYPAGELSDPGSILYFSASLQDNIDLSASSVCDFNLVFYGDQIGGGYSYREAIKAQVSANAVIKVESSLSADNGSSATDGNNTVENGQAPAAAPILAPDANIDNNSTSTPDVVVPDSGEIIQTAEAPALEASLSDGSAAPAIVTSEISASLIEGVAYLRTEF